MHFFEMGNPTATREMCCQRSLQVSVEYYKFSAIKKPMNKI